MQRRSVVEYLENFLRRGRECAYIQRRGYRTVRWSYRQVAETAFQFAHELQSRDIGKSELPSWRNQSHASAHIGF